MLTFLKKEDGLLEEKKEDNEIYINNMGVLFFRGSNLYASYSISSYV
jgi:hypothetical protein